MRRVTFAPLARRDLSDIWDYIARDSLDAADRVLVEVRAAADQLATMPGMGHVHADIRDPRYLVWRVYSYLIVYRHGPKTLTVVRVVHGARNLRRLFRKR